MYNYNPKSHGRELNSALLPGSEVAKEWDTLATSYHSCVIRSTPGTVLPSLRQTKGFLSTMLSWAWKSDSRESMPKAMLQQGTEQKRVALPL